MIRTGSEPAGPTGSGAVVLELGPGAGALVLSAPPELNGAEIDISLAGSDNRHTHSVVRPRHVAGGTQYAAIYPDLAPGSYTIWRAAGVVATTAIITSGAVTMADLDTGPTVEP
jgi:hypothetical protein